MTMTGVPLKVAFDVPSSGGPAASLAGLSTEPRETTLSFSPLPTWPPRPSALQVGYHPVFSSRWRSTPAVSQVEPSPANALSVQGPFIGPAAAETLTATLQLSLID